MTVWALPYNDRLPSKEWAPTRCLLGEWINPVGMFLWFTVANCVDLNLKSMVKWRER